MPDKGATALLSAALLGAAAIAAAEVQRRKRNATRRLAACVVCSSTVDQERSQPSRPERSTASRSRVVVRSAARNVSKRTSEGSRRASASKEANATEQKQSKNAALTQQLTASGPSGTSSQAGPAHYHQGSTPAATVSHGLEHASHAICETAASRPAHAGDAAHAAKAAQAVEEAKAAAEARQAAEAAKAAAEAAQAVEKAKAAAEAAQAAEAAKAAAEAAQAVEKAKAAAEAAQAAEAAKTAAEAVQAAQAAKAAAEAAQAVEVAKAAAEATQAVEKAKAAAEAAQANEAAKAAAEAAEAAHATKAAAEAAQAAQAAKAAAEAAQAVEVAKAAAKAAQANEAAKAAAEAAQAAEAAKAAAEAAQAAQAAKAAAEAAQANEAAKAAAEAVQAVEKAKAAAEAAQAVEKAKAAAEAVQAVEKAKAPAEAAQAAEAAKAAAEAAQAAIAPVPALALAPAPVPAPAPTPEPPLSPAEDEAERLLSAATHTWSVQGRRPAGLKLARQAVQLLQREGCRPKMMAEAISTLADMNFAEGHLQLAEDNVRVAMKCAEEAKEWVLAVKLANNLGAVLKKANKRPELLALHQSTWETAVDKLGIAHPFALVARANLVEALEEGGDAAGAKQLLQEVLDKLLSGEADQVKVVEGLGLDPHPAPINRVAARAKAESAQAAQPSAGPDSSSSPGGTISAPAEAALRMFRSAVARTYIDLGKQEMKTRQFADAEHQFRLALQYVEGMYGKGSAESGSAIFALASCFKDAGRTADALQQFKALYDLTLATQGTSNENAVGIARNLFELHSSLEQWQEAVTYAEAALSSMQQVFGMKVHPLLQPYFEMAARARLQAGDTAGAEAVKKVWLRGSAALQGAAQRSAGQKSAKGAGQAAGAAPAAGRKGRK